MVIVGYYTIKAMSLLITQQLITAMESLILSPQIASDSCLCPCDEAAFL
jgi:hypothetical protein